MGDIVIIGAGGTASHLIPPLMKMPNTDFVHIWDADSVEEINLERQMFEYRDIGQPKASVWEQRISHSRISAHLEYVGKDNIERAVAEDDTVFICADNMAVRRVIAERAATLANVTIINGGNEKDTGSVQLHIRRGSENITPAITYHSPEINFEDPDMSELSCAQIAVLPGGEQTMLANMTVAALMLHAYQRITHAMPLKRWTKMTFDINGDWQGSDVRMQGSDWA